MKKVKTSLTVAFAVGVGFFSMPVSADSAKSDYATAASDHEKVQEILDAPSACKIVHTQADEPNDDHLREYTIHNIYDFDKKIYRHIEIGTFLAVGIRVDKQLPLVAESFEELFWGDTSPLILERMEQLGKMSCADSASVTVTINSQICQVVEEVAKDNAYSYRRYDFNRGSLTTDGAAGFGRVYFEGMNDTERARAARIEDLITACTRPKSRLHPYRKLPRHPY